MSHEEEWSAFGDVEDFLAQLSSSQREVLVDSLQKCISTSAETLVDSDLNDLQEMKESNGNDRTIESGAEEICRASVISYSPGIMELQPINEDQSLFSDLAQSTLYPMGDSQSHNHQLPQSHDMLSVFGDTHIFGANLVPISQDVHLPPEAFELCHPVETVAVDAWGSTIVHGVDGGSPFEAIPTQGLMTVVDFNRGSSTSTSNRSVAMQRSRLDFCPLNSQASKKTMPCQVISPAALNQIQVVKTEWREKEWPATAAEEEVSEEEFDVKRKERRRQQNRTAARRCRNRKKETFEYLTKAAQKARLEKVELEKALVRLREKYSSVLELFKLHQTHCGLQLTVSQLRNPVLPSTS